MTLIAQLFDGIDGNGIPITTSRQTITDPTTKESILSFLRGGALIRASNGKSIDQIDPSSGNKVPRVFRTDSVWIWTAAARYYLEEYGIAPEQRFLDHIVACNYQAATPGPEARERAVQTPADRRPSRSED
ncbi:hypothetical protein [Nocardia sp. NPDC060259]|uniref:hypothetical protein n=1 Tax=Nocardia sp. NPDC060259 TaxID=3347088 RepID=UPI0036545FD1